MTTTFLTVAVPTFNRPENLIHLMWRLLPQLREGVRLVILDNHSDPPVIEYLRPLLSEFSNADIQLIRNKINVGANANILRCFELCDTEWLWVVGDDDEIEESAIETILTRLQEHPDCLLVNFPIDEKRKETKLTRGLNAFADGLDKSADVPWITSTVYRVQKLLPQIRFGYQYAFSMLPHIAMLMMSFRDDHQCFFAIDRVF